MADQVDITQKDENVFDEEQYNEEEDEDFNPDLNKQSEQEDEDEDDHYRLEQDEKGSEKKGKSSYDYSHIESESGGLVRTRRGRLLEEELHAKRKYEGLQGGTISESVNEIWEDLKQITSKRLKDRAFCGSVLAEGGDKGQEIVQEEQIMVKRSYKFAGEVVHEEKMVPISSPEAQEYLKRRNAKQEAEDVQKKVDEKTGDSSQDERDRRRLRRPLKRPPYLEQIISGSLKPKLTTLEKSSLDWAAYVNKEGLSDELTLYNKDGYLAKQDFLDRVEMVKDSKYRELRQKQLAAQLQEQQ